MVPWKQRWYGLLRLSKSAYQRQLNHSKKGEAPFWARNGMQLKKSKLILTITRARFFSNNRPGGLQHSRQSVLAGALLILFR